MLPNIELRALQVLTIIAIERLNITWILHKLLMKSAKATLSMFEKWNAFAFSPVLI